jgi:hypothetical protein
VACDSPTGSNIPSDRNGQWQLDIDVLGRQLTELHPNLFARIPRSRFEAEIESLKSAVPSLSDPEIVVGLMRILGQVGDSHTTIDWRSYTGFRQLPLRFEWFADGIHVVAATEEYRQALGLRVLRVGAASVEAAIEALREVIPYENESWLRFSLVSMMTVPEVLGALRLAADPSRVSFELADVDGSSVALEVPAAPRLPLTLVEAGPPPEGRPLYRQRPGENYWLVYLEPSRTLYVQYRRASDGVPPFSQFASRIVEMLDTEPVDKLVLDLRNNTGGNSGLMEPLLSALERRPRWSGGEGLYTLIGRATFSSALMNAFDLKSRTRAILAGEPTGGKPNHFGQVSSFILPTSRVQVFHSTRFFRLTDSDPQSLEPDIFVEITSQDFLEGRDPVLEAVWNR